MKSLEETEDIALVLLCGEIEEQREYDGTYTTMIRVGDSRFEVRATGDVARKLAGMRSGARCACLGSLVEENWETAYDGRRSKVYVRVGKVYGV